MSRVTSLLGLAIVLFVVACDDKPETPKAPAAGGSTATPKVDPTIQQKADELIADTKAKLEKVKSLVSEKKFDEADTVLKGVEAVKDKLPADLQKLVEQSRSMLDTARKTVGALPTMPK